LSAQPDSEIDVRAFFGVLRRHLRTIVLVVVLVAAVVYGWSATRPDRYAATARVQVVNETDASTNRGNSRTETEQEVSTQVELIESPALRRQLDERLGDTAGAVQEVEAAGVEETPIVRIRVTSTSPDTAAAAANALADVFVQRQRQIAVTTLGNQAEELRRVAAELTVQIDALNAQLLTGVTPNRAAAEANRNVLVDQRSAALENAAELQLEATVRSGGVALVDEADVPQDPFEPRPWRDTTFAAIVALLVAISLVLLAERLDDKFRTPEDLQRLRSPVPLLASIPVVRKGPRWADLRANSLPRRRRELVHLASPVGEGYRTLRTSLRFASAGERRRTIAVTSSIGGEGKTTVTANLAAALAESGLRVVVVSADLRAPQVGAMLGVDDRGTGLTMLVRGAATLEECLVDAPRPGAPALQVLPAGPAVPNPAELLGSPEMAQVLDKIIGQGVDYVLVDCPPVLPVSDTLAVARHVDGVIVLCGRGLTRFRALQDTLERLRHVEANVIGFVFNGVDISKRGYARYYKYDVAAEPAHAATSTEGVTLASSTPAPPSSG
jgi:capsular exopolysaccharide synthesis family protein